MENTNRTSDEDLEKIIFETAKLKDEMLYETCIRAVENYREIKEDVGFVNYLISIRDKYE